MEKNVENKKSKKSRKNKNDLIFIFINQHHSYPRDIISILISNNQS